MLEVPYCQPLQDEFSGPDRDSNGMILGTDLILWRLDYMYCRLIVRTAVASPLYYYETCYLPDHHRRREMKQALQPARGLLHFGNRWNRRDGCDDILENPGGQASEIILHRCMATDATSTPARSLQVHADMPPLPSDRFASGVPMLVVRELA